MKRIVVFSLAALLASGCATQKAAQLREQGELLLAQNNPAGAEAAYKEARSLEPLPVDSLRLGHLLAERGECLEALPLLDEAKGLEGREREIVLDQASCHQMLGALADAADAYVRAIELDTKDTTTTLKTAEIWPKLDKHPCIEEWLDRLAIAQPERSYAWTFKGNRYFRMGNYAQAKAAFEKALSLYPNSAPTLIRLAVTLAKTDDLDGAEARYQAALALEEDRAARLGLAGVQYLKGDFDKSLMTLVPLRNANPEDREATILEAQNYFVKGDMDKAWELVRKLLPMMGENLPLMRFAGSLAMKKKEFASAENLYRSLWNRDPKLPEDGEPLGICLVELGKTDEAREIFTRVILLDPKRASTRRELGKLYYATGLLPAALATLKEAARLNPADIETQGYLGFASFDSGSGSYPDARDSLRQYVQEKPEAAALVRLAGALSATGDQVGAQANLEKAASLGFSDSAFLKHSAFSEFRKKPAFATIEKRIQANSKTSGSPSLVPIR